MQALSNFQLVDEIYGAGKTRICRAVNVADGRPVILKILSGEHLQPDAFAQYQREFDVTSTLKDVPGVIKVYGLENIQDSVMIVEEDIGGRSLASILETERIDLPDALNLAVRITHILGQIHQRHVVHKDFNPANIIWNRATDELRVIDFGISSQLSQERQEFQSVKQLEANLAYASPEQTGRVNRKVDSRSDLYSLGVTLYQMMTGVLPFVAREGIELVHAHIARMPVPPHDVSPEIPLVVSQIILRLMAKMADDRYQSAWGLEQDLRRCLDQLHDTGEIAVFPLAEHDASTRFHIPQKLYGREGEISTIVKAFDRAAAGTPELLLVSGFSGTGKSALVHEVHRPLTERHGSFIAGKFDQYQRDVPFYAWTLAFEEFCNLLLKEDEASLAPWRERISAALGTIGKVITDVIPSIELIIGTQPEVPPLAGEQALNRLNYAFGKFVKAICRKENPLVVFLDDWQWADAGSLSLLKSVMGNKDIQFLLLIGAYRDNEIHPAHPFAVALDDIRKGDAVVSTIDLAALRQEDVHCLVRDALNDSPGLENVSRLAYEKTRGNAFFLVQLLTDLYEKSVIYFSPESRTWTWRQEKIESRNIADNVIDLMTAKIRRLPEAAQRSLIHAACIGDRFELATLAAILEKPGHQAAGDLEAALREGILLPIGLGYRVARQEGNTNNVSYQFIHDRVRQAAYGLLDKEAAEKIHCHIGGKWLAESSPAEQDLHIFDIANQYNAGRRLVTDPQQKNQLVIINLKAGKRAKGATAYSTALHYFQMAIELRPANCWRSMADHAAELYLLAAEAAFLTKNYELMASWLDEYLGHCYAPLDRVKAFKIQLQAFVAQNRLSEAVDVALHALGMLGITLPKSPGALQVMGKLLQTKFALRGKSLADLHALPAMTDPARLEAMELLGLTIPPAYWTSQELVALTVFQMVRESVAHGYSPNAGYGYSWWGITECAMLGNIDSGYEFGEFAIDLAKRHDLNLQQPLFFSAWIIQKFKRPLRDSIPVFEQTYALSLEKGDFEYASYARNNHIQALFHTGRTLGLLLPEMELAHRDLQRFQIGSSLYWHSIWWQTARNFVETSGQPHVLAGPAYDEATSLPQHLKVNDGSTLFLLYCAKLMLSCIFHDQENALINAERAGTYVKGGVGMHAFVLFHFYESLALLGNVAGKGVFARWRMLRKVAANQKKLATWAAHAPMNYRHHWLLVEAERLRVGGRSDQALRFYDQAIDLARENGFIHEEALAHELAARCFVQRDQNRLATFYLKQSLQLYERWGASAKSAQLAAEFSELLLTVALPGDLQRTSRGRTSGARHSGGGTQHIRAFDILAVTEASQAISREIVIGNMITTLLKIVIEHSGAQKALLILKNGDELTIQAQGLASQTTEVSVAATPITDDDELPLPRSIIQYVGRTSKSLVIHDARQENLFFQDPYFLREKPLSVLCEPIVHQGKLIGMLYLENTLTADAFTEERLELLRMLSSQAAISIENALLYADMEARIRDRTRELAELLETVKIKGKQVSALLDNSGQGFLSVGADLIAQPEFSQACVTFFGGSPAGRRIDTLLFGDNAHAGEVLRDCIAAALGDDDPDRCSLYLSLLPDEITIGDRVLEAEFKMLDRAIMVVLTDITAEKILAAQVARERTRLEMIVSAVTGGSDFFEAVAEFRTFAQTEPASWHHRNRAELYRAVHTFKGTFSQFGFHHVPAELHEVETSLQHMDEAMGAAEAAALVFGRDWGTLLDADLQTVTAALGEDFMARRGVVTIPPDQAKRFEMFARGLLDQTEAPKVLDEIAAIRSISLRQALGDFDKLVTQVSSRLDKAVAPLVVRGDDVRIDPEAFGPFLRSLGHIFRNAVDHGIEDPEARLVAGKSESGAIVCDISGDAAGITITIADDGNGIDVDTLRHRAALLTSKDVGGWGLADLVFAEGISARTEVTELSGRGIGMTAVRATVEALGGSIEIDSRPGQGTSFHFRIPLVPAARNIP